MPSIEKMAPRDQVRQFVITFKSDDGEREDVHLEYYRNRISLAPMDALISDDDAKEMSDAELDALRAASTMCYYLKSWDVTGELADYQGNVLVEAGEVVPLDPRITQYMPTPVVGEIMRKLTEEVFPDSGKSRNERRRSR